MKPAPDGVIQGWQRLGSVPLAVLEETRKQLHWAAQAIAAAARAWVEPQDDDAHTSMVFVESPARFVGMRAPRGQRLALLVQGPRLELSGDDGEAIEGFDLPGESLDRALAWLGDAMQRADRRPCSTPPQRPDYDLPAHAVERGAPFAAGDPQASAELARWYGNAARLLESLRETTRGASPVRCWPHHFDIATLVSVEVAADSRDAKSIGVGFSPGDASYAEPYFYVNPWPHPEPSSLPPPPPGASWHTDGWTGAVLPARRLIEEDSASAQAGLACSYIQSAFADSRTLLAAG